MFAPTEDWVLEDFPHLEKLLGEVYLRFQVLPRRHRFPIHSHRWNQLVYASSGTLLVTLDDHWHVISPEQAIWVPAGLMHSTGALQEAQFRNLYIAGDVDVGMPQRSQVLSVRPLLRALIVELAEVYQRSEDEAYIERLKALTLDQLPRQPVLDFHLPWPRSVMLRRMCQELLANPADTQDLKTWSETLGISRRTLTRHFERELGISLREWRLRLRLFKALELLETQDDITQIALELGYNTPSAFTYMFRQRMGRSPSDWRRR
ncbi:helix-turn-helix transcriptional regulator [Telmatospirillum sp.]|uniref:AraC family transcriptional regulator n=1 Tax=Telmatospirillum sp. TaxID=2079197 RepID=UPI00283C4248|nr:helix-turn-helix transcriptional regulator [Telmatospirillum sp.]MDR3439063.1 helix-turn-helix transcriptional regulator [Telmatospirillum sp.]